jgi:hypothetical protein
MILYRGIGQQKTPHPFPGAGFLESSPDVARRALTRTSVGNEKYEYKDENRIETRASEQRTQAGPVHLLLDGGGAAVRHDTDPNESTGPCQQFFSSACHSVVFSPNFTTWTARRPDGFATRRLRYGIAACVIRPPRTTSNIFDAAGTGDGGSATKKCIAPEMPFGASVANTVSGDRPLGAEGAVAEWKVITNGAMPLSAAVNVWSRGRVAVGSSLVM